LTRGEQPKTWKSMKECFGIQARGPQKREALGISPVCPMVNPALKVALENCHLSTTWQESQLMFRNNGLLHHNVIIAAGLLSQAQAGKPL